MRQRLRGFSLVELSIVLVILGLLVGGILSGRSLIRASELRSISTQYNSYYTATRAFRDKYFALPGDMTNATQFWGELDPVAMTCRLGLSTDTKTCNGNGDGMVSTSAASVEDFRYWQHLGNAGLIMGQYCGAPACPEETRLPKGRLKNGVWSLFYFGDLGASDELFAASYGNAFLLGTIAGKYLLRPEEVWNIDLKMDDGKPAYGKILAVGDPDDYLTLCTDDTSSNPNANYLLGSSEIGCRIIFRDQF